MRAGVQTAYKDNRDDCYHCTEINIKKDIRPELTKLKLPERLVRHVSHKHRIMLHICNDFYVYI